MPDLFRQRLTTPDFLRWTERDGVNGRDVSRAVVRLQRRMHTRVVSLSG